MNGQFDAILVAISIIYFTRLYQGVKVKGDKYY